MVGTRPSFRFMPLRVAAAGLLALALILAIPGALLADSSEWTLVQAEGDVQIQPAGSAWMPISVSNAVPAGSVLRTGENGRAVLESDGDRIFVSPNSRLELPAGEPGGAVTHVHQSLGTMLYDIFTGNDFATPAAERFRVDTPYLAAVIKGTAFTVTVGAEGAAVHVIKGIVQVTNARGRNAASVHPGETATVPPRADGDVTVLGRDGSTTGADTTEPIRDANSGMPPAAPVSSAGVNLAGTATQAVDAAASAAVGTAVPSVGSTLSSVGGTLSGVGATASSAVGTAVPSVGGALFGAGGTLSALRGILPGAGSGSVSLGGGKNALGGVAGAVKP